MAYDEGLAERLRESFKGTPAMREKRMFGGLCFLHHGNMCCGIVRDSLMARVGADQYEACLALPHTTLMDFTGKPMKGMVYVQAEGLAEEADLQQWVARCLAFVRTLPPKP